MKRKGRESRMKFLAHRGYWKNPADKNTKEALAGALQKGYGIETDIRDYNGGLVVAHDIPDESAIPLEEILAAFEGHGLCFAANIKADGLGSILFNLLNSYGVTEYFAFDMSVPQMVEYRDAGICFYTRLSDIEREPVLYAKASGVWIDSFSDYDWITPETILPCLRDGKKVCLVSPELHGKDHRPMWDMLLTIKHEWDKIYLCTDFIDEAERFFFKSER